MTEPATRRGPAESTTDGGTEGGSKPPVASPHAAAALRHLETDWRRLDPRMLLVHLVQEPIRFLPVLLGVFILGSTDDGGRRWEWLALPLILAVGALRYVTTRYRITGGQIELRKGLLTKQVIATPADRVRTVDVTSPPIHRLLRLAKVELGTAGTGHGERLVLDALPLTEARRLREELIHLRSRREADAPEPLPPGPVAPAPSGQPYDLPPPVESQRTETTLLQLRPAWVRYAPLTMTGFVSALALFGFANQFITRALERGVVADAVDRLGGTPWWVDTLVGTVVLLTVVAVLSVIGYVLQFWGFRLTRHSGGTLHVTRGLLTSRESSIEERRIRGLEVGEPFGLRLARGGRLHVVTTGIGQREERRGTAWLVPPAPRSVVEQVAAEVVGDQDALSGTLRQHGRYARRRRYLRALVPSLVLASVGVWLVVGREWPLGVAVAAVTPLLVLPFVAADRYAGLGHRLTADHLVVRSGSFVRRRDVLQRSGVIGWTVQSSFFQRRVGLAHLVATTAAGKQSYTAYDIPLDQAVTVAHEVTPDLICQFLA